MTRLNILRPAAAALAAALAAAQTAPALAQTTELVSKDNFGVQGNEDSRLTLVDRAISADGRYVAFSSRADNLVAGDTNSRRDVFVHDRDSGTTARVSVSSTGDQGNGDSLNPSISADGRYVAFYSRADNLVAGDTNNRFDIFVHDRDSGTTERVSVSSAGGQGNDFSAYASLSADGRYVAFNSRADNLVAGDTNSDLDIFVHDRDGGTTERVSVSSSGDQADKVSWPFSSISADGRYVAFYSFAANLVPGDTNTEFDVFVHDRQTGTTERVSVSSGGDQSNLHSGFPSINADGSAVAFISSANNLAPGADNGYAQVLVHERVTNTAPTADAGLDLTVACTAAAGTEVTLDGSGSSDPEEDLLEYAWTGAFGSAGGVAPTVALGLGTSTATLVLNDGALDSEPDTVDITVAADVEGLLWPLAALVPYGDEPPLPERWGFFKKWPLPPKAF